MENQVDLFVTDLELVSSFKARIINEIRAFFKAQATEAVPIEERIIYGGVGFFIGGKHFGGAYPNKQHVNLAFSQGVELSDPKALLQGKGKYRRHLQLFSFDELEEKDAQEFVNQAIKLCTSKSG
ncbi:MAG: DUF1801 domain-containing protein [Anaerolineae bacterium]